jgi:hypothetical protein
MGLLSIRIDKYNSKEVKESIFLAEAREMQNQLLKAAEALQDTPVTSSSKFGKSYHSLKRMDTKGLSNVLLHCAHENRIQK